eukprot:gene15784-21376_t
MTTIFLLVAIISNIFKSNLFIDSFKHASNQYIQQNIISNRKSIIQLNVFTFPRPGDVSRVNPNRVVSAILSPPLTSASPSPTSKAGERLENESIDVNKPAVVSLPKVAKSYNPAEYIKVPTLSKFELLQLSRGQGIQRQLREGRSGTGLIVLEVNASADKVFQTLTRFRDYKELISTVKSARVISTTSDRTVSEYYLSKFMLRVIVEQTVIADQRIIKFGLSKNHKNGVLQTAEGFWYVEEPKDRPEGTCRVWLSASLIASPLVPSFIIDYAAKRSMPKATNWIKPYFAGLPYEEPDTDGL